MCLDQGIVKPGTDIDHIIPHKGDAALFYDPNNLQTLCKWCHHSVKARIERGCGTPAFDVNGMPLDKAHHWNG